MERVNHAAIAGALLGNLELAIADFERGLGMAIPESDWRAAPEDNLGPQMVPLRRRWRRRRSGPGSHAASSNAWQLDEALFARGDFVAALCALREDMAYAKMARNEGAQTREVTLRAVPDGLLRQRREAKLHDGEERK